MNIVVLVKQTFDTEAKIVIKDGQIESNGISLIINPYDEFAVEEAIRIKEKLGGEITALGLGAASPAALRHALAMGADRAAMLVDEAFTGDAGVAAAALAKYISSIDCDLLLAGSISVDEQSGQVAARVAAQLDMPVVNGVTNIEVDDSKALCRREIEGGYEMVEVQLPALITAQKGLNEPRYPSMPNIMKSKSKELKTVSAADIGFEAMDSLSEVLQIELPPTRAAGKIISGDAADCAKELVNLLKTEARVIS